MKDIADAANRHTREEIYCRAAKHGTSSRPKTKVLPPSPGHKGQAVEGGTNLQRNKGMEPIAEEETTTDLAVTNAINATQNAPKLGDPTPTAKTRGEKLGGHLAPRQTTWRI